MTQILDIPPEIFIEILSLLEVTDLFSCMRTCRFLDEIIGNSYQLRYLMQLKIAGMQDNPYCTLSTVDRLDLLKEREAAWQTFNWKFLTTIDVPCRSSGVYDVTPSVYLLGKSAPDVDLTTTGIQSLKLPSQFPDEMVEWNEFDFGMDIIDFGTAIEEHDLLACVSSVPDQDDPNSCHIIVVLLRYSTKRTYDDCQKPAIPICKARNIQGSPSISIEIVGENLAVIVVFDRDLTTSSDYMYIIDWKTGRSKSNPLQIYNPGLTFLREDILVNPNIVRKSLDIYHVPSSSALSSLTSSTSVRLVHSLLLPSLKPGQHITGISCRGDPSPTHNSAFPKYTRRSKPYANDPLQAIIILTLQVRPFTREVSRNFIMIVHRNSLLDLVPDEQSRPMLQSRPSTRGRQEHMSMLPWNSWGPAATRWFNADDFSTIFITTTSGQRCVQFTPSIRRQTPNEDEDDDERPNTMHILDFNPWHVRLARHLNDAFNVGVFRLVGKEPVTGEEEPEENICLGQGAFSENIVGRLPYIRCTSDDKWDYDGVLMDEERILGLTEQSEPESFRIESLDVIYFG